MLTLKDMNDVRVALFSHYGVENMNLINSHVRTLYDEVYECQARDMGIPVERVYEMRAAETRLTRSAEEAFGRLSSFLGNIGVSLQSV